MRGSGHDLGEIEYWLINRSSVRFLDDDAEEFGALRLVETRVVVQGFPERASIDYGVRSSWVTVG